MAAAKKSIYEIGKEYRDLEALLVESEGELTPELEKRFDEFMVASSEKLDAAAAIVRQLKGEDEVYKREIDRITKKRKAKAANVERLRARILDLVKTAHGGELKTAFNSFSVDTLDDIVTVVVDPEKVSLDVLRTENPALVQTTYSIDREEVLRRQQEGGPIPEGITVESVTGRLSLTIR